MGKSDHGRDESAWDRGIVIGSLNEMKVVFVLIERSSYGTTTVVHVSDVFVKRRKFLYRVCSFTYVYS
jgi:hypothetical protein